MSYLINIAMKATSDKMRKRVMFYNSFDDESFDVIDKKCLPKEYGGTVPMEEMSSEFLRNFVGKSHLMLLELPRTTVGTDDDKARTSHEV